MRKFLTDTLVGALVLAAILIGLVLIFKFITITFPILIVIFLVVGSAAIGETIRD